MVIFYLDQRRNNSALDDGTLNIDNVNSNDNEDSDAASNYMETHNNSDTNENPIDQRSDIINEDDACFIFNAPTVTSPDDTYDSRSTLNDETTNGTNADKDSCDVDDGHNHENDENIGAKETID